MIDRLLKESDVINALCGACEDAETRNAFMELVADIPSVNTENWHESEA